MDEQAAESETHGDEKPYAGVSLPARWVARGVDGVLAVLLAVLFVVAVVGVFSRYVLNYSFGWAEELSGFVFLWVGMLGAAVGVAADRHVALTWISDRLPGGVRAWVYRGVMLLCAGVLAVLGYYGWRLMQLLGRGKTPALEIPGSWIYAAVTVASAIGLWFVVERLIRYRAPRSHEKQGKTPQEHADA